MTKSQTQPHEEDHKSHRAAWLRAAVLGANDGIVSTASLMLGVLAAARDEKTILTAGIAGLVAGALSMAAGEYVSVSSQKDSEEYDLRIETASLRDHPEHELQQLASIYEKRGLDKKLAVQVATALHKHDALAAHARDELNIDPDELAKPLQAAVASAGAFSFGAVIPIIAAVLSSDYQVGAWAISISALIALAVSGALGAYVGGGHRVRAALRVFIGGGAAMLITYIIGHLIGGVVGL